MQETQKNEEKLENKTVSCTILGKQKRKRIDFETGEVMVNKETGEPIYTRKISVSTAILLDEYTSGFGSLGETYSVTNEKFFNVFDKAEIGDACKIFIQESVFTPKNGEPRISKKMTDLIIRKKNGEIIGLDW